MKKLIKIIRNKYIYTSLFLVFYILILHETDVVTLINRKNRVQDLELEIERKKEEILDLKLSIGEIDDVRSLEKFARENHLFKKADEDLFIFSFE